MSTCSNIRETQKTHVLIDLDGTICDILIDWTNWEKGLAELFSKYEKTQVSELINKNLEENFYVAKHGEPLLTELRTFIQEYESKYTTGFAPVLTTLSLIEQIKDLNLYVWSANSEKTVYKALTQFGISSYFKRLIGRESVVMQKPDPEGFLLLNRQNPQIDKSAYVFIGNAPNDALAAQNAGIEYINVNEIVIED